MSPMSKACANVNMEFIDSIFGFECKKNAQQEILTTVHLCTELPRFDCQKCFKTIAMYLASTSTIFILQTKKKIQPKKFHCQQCLGYSIDDKIQYIQVVDFITLLCQQFIFTDMHRTN